jgi:hypothetical protein
MSVAHSTLILGYQDYSEETSTVTVPGTVVADLAVGNPLWVALKAAIEGVMIDPVNQREARVTYDIKPSSVGSTNPLAQRECKWLVRGVDSVTGTKHKLEIPQADLTLLDPANKGKMLISSGDGAQLKTDLEAVWMSSETGNAITVVDIIHVGRNT